MFKLLHTNICNEKLTCNLPNHFVLRQTLSIMSFDKFSKVFLSSKHGLVSLINVMLTDTDKNQFIFVHEDVYGLSSSLTISAVPDIIGYTMLNRNTQTRILSVNAHCGVKSRDMIKAIQHNIFVHTSEFVKDGLHIYGLHNVNAVKVFKYINRTIISIVPSYASWNAAALKYYSEDLLYPDSRGYFMTRFFFAKL